MNSAANRGAKLYARLEAGARAAHDGGMTSATYELFRRAILARKQVTCTYRSRYRELCPHILGRTGGAEKVLAFQFGGETSSVLPPGGEWRCLDLVHVEGAAMRDGPWHAGTRHRRTQSCVKDIDLDINVHVRTPAPAEAAPLRASRRRHAGKKAMSQVAPARGCHSAARRAVLENRPRTKAKQTGTRHETPARHRFARRPPRHDSARRGQ